MTLYGALSVKPIFRYSPQNNETVDYADPRVRGEPGGGARIRAATLYSVGSFEPKP
jgi:hypothetical protein